MLRLLRPTFFWRSFRKQWIRADSGRNGKGISWHQVPPGGLGERMPRPNEIVIEGDQSRPTNEIFYFVCGVSGGGDQCK